MESKINMRFDLNAFIAQHRASIMGISILMIMLYHQTWFYDGAIWEYSHLTGRWGVDVFLFLSGWGIVHSLRKNTIKKFYVNRCVRLWPICIVSGLLQVVLNSIGFEGSSGFPVVLTCLGMFKWFIMAVCLFYAVSPLLYWTLTRSGKITVLCVLVFVLLMKYFHCFEQGNVIVTTISMVIERFPAYVLGMYVCMYVWRKQVAIQ